jgi:hypothetical protein
VRRDGDGGLLPEVGIVASARGRIEPLDDRLTVAPEPPLGRVDAGGAAMPLDLGLVGVELAAQSNTTWICEGSATLSTLSSIRKRWPSGLTSNPLKSNGPPGKGSGCGLPARPSTNVTAVSDDAPR